MATLDDDDPARDWDDAATLIELLPDDLAEIDREETTPTLAPEKLPGYEIGRRAGVDAAITAVGDILAASSNTTPGEVARFLDLVRERLRQPAQDSAPRTPAAHRHPR